MSDPDAPATPAPSPPEGGRLQVLFVGSGIPLHGVPVILNAVARAPDVHLTLVGGTREERQEASAFPETRLTLLPSWVDGSEVHRLLARSHLALGIFSAGAKASRVIPFKVVHALAAGRAVLTADTPPVRRFLLPGADCFTARAGDPLDLSSALRFLSKEQGSLAEVGRRARKTYDRTFSTEAVAFRLLGELEAVAGGSWRGAGRTGVPAAVR